MRVGADESIRHDRQLIVPRSNGGQFNIHKRGQVFGRLYEHQKPVFLGHLIVAPLPDGPAGDDAGKRSCFDQRSHELNTRDIIDPGNGELIAQVPESSKEDAVVAILAARKAFDSGPWKTTLALDRAKMLFKLADLIRANAMMLAELETRNCGKPLAEEVSAQLLARRTPGFSGADLANLVNEAALLAARYDKTKIGVDDFNESVDRVVAGPQRKSRIMNDKTRERIAYHEVGHAIVGELLPNADPVHKVSILPRGQALGYTMHYPTEDKYLTTAQEFLERISSLLAGRVAEEIVFNEVTTGASNDFERATAIARSMVCEYGMSKALGPVVLGTRHGNPFLGRDWNEERNYSENIAQEIDREVRAIIDGCYEHSRQILTENRVKMEEIVRVLLEKEILEREDFIALLEGAKAPEFVAPSVTPVAPPSQGDTPIVSAPEKPRRIPTLRPEPA